VDDGSCDPSGGCYAYDGFGCGIGQSFPCESEEAKKWNPLLYPDAFFGDVIHIDSNGRDKNISGNSSLSCNSLKEGKKHFTNDPTSTTFLIQSDVIITSQLSISSESTNIPSFTIKSRQTGKMRTVTITNSV
jgi:hypothetical protein